MVRSTLVLYSIHVLNMVQVYFCKTEIVISIWQHFRSEERQMFKNVQNQFIFKNSLLTKYFWYKLGQFFRKILLFNIELIQGQAWVGEKYHCSTYEWTIRNGPTFRRHINLQHFQSLSRRQYVVGDVLLEMCWCHQLDDNYKMCVTILAILVTNNIQKMSPTSKFSNQHPQIVTSCQNPGPSVAVSYGYRRLHRDDAIVEQKWINNLALSAPKMHSTWTQHKLNISKLRLKMTQRELKMNTKCTFEAKLTRKKLWCQCDSLWHRDYVHVSQIMIMWLIIPLICSWVHDRRSVISNSKII